MRHGRLFAGSVLLLAALPSFGYSRSHRGPTSQHSLAKRASKASARPVGQRTIDDSRATQIQTALTSAGYLQGEPTGRWDAATQSAMQKYQADHGWQTKLIPDSRAIIKLGLGPNSGSEATVATPSMNDKADARFPTQP